LRIATASWNPRRVIWSFELPTIRDWMSSNNISSPAFPPPAKATRQMPRRVICHLSLVIGHLRFLSAIDSPENFKRLASRLLFARPIFTPEIRLLSR
jgi:hypothetical protein